VYIVIRSLINILTQHINIIKYLINQNETIHCCYHSKPRPIFEETLFFLAESSLVEQIVIVSQEPGSIWKFPGVIFLFQDSHHPKHLTWFWAESVRGIFFSSLRPKRYRFKPKTLERILEMAESTKAGLIYSDFYDKSGNRKNFILWMITS